MLPKPLERELFLLFVKLRCYKNNSRAVRSSYKNRGVQPLIDAVVDIFRPLLTCLRLRALILVLKKKSCDMLKRAFSALAFKIATILCGKLTFIKIYSGVLKLGENIYNVSGKRGG